MTANPDSFQSKQTLEINGKAFSYYSLKKAQENAENNQLANIDKLPYSLKVLLENILRNESADNPCVKDAQIFNQIAQGQFKQHEINFRPARVLMQDFTGVPAIVDLAAMREAMIQINGDPEKINPLIPVDLVIDHSVIIDHFGEKQAFYKNSQKEYHRNKERYRFLKWGQQSFKNFRVVPPGTGICHQVNLEYLAKPVFVNHETSTLYPDSLVGTDSHTTMVNALGVIGWGVGGIEAEAAMLNQPISMLIPQVVGVKLINKLQNIATATDLVLTITQKLRKLGVVGKFVEYFGPGLANITLEDRATIANMAPEYGSTCGFFPVDEITINYLKKTGRPAEIIEIAEQYCKLQGLFYHPSLIEPNFSQIIEIDLSKITPSLAGPKRPQDLISLHQVPANFAESLNQESQENQQTTKQKTQVKVTSNRTNQTFELQQGAIAIASITSCTNTSNPYVMISAGLLAKNAVAKNLTVKPWVKTSLAPGSQVVQKYYDKANLTESLEKLGFHIVGFGCATCIGNSGPLEPEISQAIKQNNLTVCSVLSGNRNFEGRISPDVKANYLASPPLVIAYALAGNINIDLVNQPIGQDSNKQNVMLKDIWPSQEQVNQIIKQTINEDMFNSTYRDVFKGDDQWQKVKISKSKIYSWQSNSTYIRKPPYFDNLKKDPENVPAIKNARILAIFGDSITTDHISPAGSIAQNSPSATYLNQNNVKPEEYNQYGTRRGNHEVMIRGTFANAKIKNKMVEPKKGGYTKMYPSGEIMPIFNAANQYQQNNINTVIFAGLEYGTGSSRDWAAKGTALLGVKAIIAQSFERIHRSNLIGMGVLPLMLPENTSPQKLKLTGNELISIPELNNNIQARSNLTVIIEKTNPNNQSEIIKINCLLRIDTEDEIKYYLNNGILSMVVRKLAAS